MSATTALGLHRQMDTAQPISFLSEMKKYLFIVVFNVDKSASLLTGRPPALSYRYTRFELPLDLDDDIIIRGGDQLRKAIDALDANGVGNLFIAHHSNVFALAYTFSIFSFPTPPDQKSRLTTQY